MNDAEPSDKLARLMDLDAPARSGITELLGRLTRL